MFIYQVIVNLPLRQKFHYKHEKYLENGLQVVVKFKNKLQVGFIVECIKSDDYNEYPIEKLSSIDQVNFECKVSKETISLVIFLSSYYHHALSSTLFTVLPNQMHKLQYAPPKIKQRVFYRVVPNLVIKFKSVKQEDIYNYIAKYDMVSLELLIETYGKSISKILTSMLNQGIICQVTDYDKSKQVNFFNLTEEQSWVYQQILANLTNFHAGLLYGITGSGKTEVFMHIIEQILKNRQQVLLLIPEINLTPQLLNWFSSRFIYANIQVLNSEVQNKLRHDIWHSCEIGEVDIVIGTRLSVFTPFKKLGLIIVDEEHDNSFKQNDNLRYNARDVAVWRAKQLNIPVILSSATPSMESLYNYKLGRYSLYKIASRAVSNAKLPQINLIDIQQNKLNYAGLSQVVIKAITNNLNNKELSLIYINRRGYAPVITCYDCGWVSCCRNCSTKMVYHHDKKQIKCHFCGYQTCIPQQCPKCANQYLHTIGYGTQKLEEFLHLHFPQASVLRVDRDTVYNKQGWDNLYKQINHGKVDIIVGTQMLAKGHNFDNLTLVVGLNIDSALFSYDFRSSENMFQVLTQVSGRAGRGEKAGKVLLQTNYPQHPIYDYICKHDFNGFIIYLQKERKVNNLPPYSHLVIIRVSCVNEDKLQLGLKELYQLAKSIEHHGVELFFAIPAVLYKLYNRYRGQMLIASKDRQALHNYLVNLEANLHKLSYVTIAIDVDPLEV